MMKKRTCKVGKVRRIVGDILLFLCAVFLIYCAGVMIYRFATVLPNKIWPAARRFFAEFGIMCLIALPACDIRFGLFAWKKNRAVKAIGIVTRILSYLICAAFVTLGAAVVITGTIKDDKPVEGVIVLGLSIDGDKMAKDLEHRLDTALAYKSDHPDTPFIVTGGNSEDPYYSEAGYMSRYLQEKGFDTSSGELIAETNAKTTVENFKYSSAFVDKEKPVGVVTSDLHMFRATGIAKKQGYTDIVRIPAPSEPFLYGENVIWEAICSFFQILKGNLAF